MNKSIIMAGNIVTSFGNSMYVVALLIYITETRPHPFNIGSIQAAAYLPVALFGIWGGILADRRKRPGIIAGTDLIRSLFLLAAAAAMSYIKGIHPLLIFLPLVFLNALMQAFFSPAVISYILDLKHGKTDLLSLRTGSGHLAALAGQALGAALFPVYGLIPLLLINSLCFFASGISELFLRESDTRPLRSFEAKAFSLRNLSELSRDFFSLEKKGVPLFLYLGMQGINCLLVLNLPFLLTKRLGFPAEYIGYGLAGLMGGSILSGLFLGLTGMARRSGSISAHGASLLFAGLCLTAGGLPPGGSFSGSFLIPFLLLIAAGACQGWIHLITIHQVNRGGDSSSRAGRQGILEAAAAAVLPAAYLISGGAASFLPLDTPWLIRAAAVLAAGLSFLSLRRLRGRTGQVSIN